jgi:hypothetical protein
LKDARRVVL